MGIFLVLIFQQILVWERGTHSVYTVFRDSTANLFLQILHKQFTRLKYPWIWHIGQLLEVIDGAAFEASVWAAGSK